MKAFCIPKHLASELKQAAQAGDINIKDLYDMTSEQRREVFQKYTDLETAKQINSGFEESIVSSQKDALKKWAEKTFVGKEKQSKQYKDVIDKIDQLDELGALNYKDATSFLEDMVSTRYWRLRLQTQV
jgi:transcriptional/translational regulatory protein YebC/TACO1